MLNSLLTARMSPPRFEDRISSFTVTFPNHTLLGEETVRWITALGEPGLTDSQCVALAMLREEDVLDNRAYRNATGVDSRVATAELQDLVARELVTQAGTRRWAQYRLSPRITARAGSPSRADHRPGLLAALVAPARSNCSRKSDPSILTTLLPQRPSCRTGVRQAVWSRPVGVRARRRR
jgi:ATP-dependent DNA helicase RecG